MLKEKLVLLGSFRSGSTNISQAQAFRNIGWEVVEYDLVSRLKHLRSPAARDEEIFQTCAFEEPRMVLISKGAGISRECIQRLKKITCTVLWYMDPLDDNWNPELRERITCSDITVCALLKPFELARKLNPNSFFVHEGYDSAVDFPIQQRRKWDVSFIGQTKGRRRLYQVATGFKVIRGAFGTDHARAVGQSKINLNFVVNDSGCSDRVYKILAAGGFLLTADWPGRSQDFKDGKDLVIFEGISDLDSKIREYLKDPWKRSAIANRGRETVQQFSREAYAEKISELVSEHIAKRILQQ